MSATVGSLTSPHSFWREVGDAGHGGVVGIPLFLGPFIQHSFRVILYGRCIVAGGLTAHRFDSSGLFSLYLERPLL